MVDPKIETRNQKTTPKELWNSMERLDEGTQELLTSIFDQSDLVSYFGGKFKFAGGSTLKSAKNAFDRIGLAEKLEDAGKVQEALALHKEQYREFLDFLEAWTEARATIDAPEFETNTAESLEKTEEWAKNLKPAILVSEKKGDAIILLDPENENRPTPVNPDFYLAHRGTDYQKLVKDPHVPKVFPTFDPYTTETIVTKEIKNTGREGSYINYFIPPQWRYLDAEPKYHGRIKEFIEHLFPIERDREQVLDWCHHAITNRNNTVLCLIGAQGTGKTIFIANLLAALVGHDYSQSVGQAVLEEKFNSAFKDSRLIYFDEVFITEDAHLNKFKALANRIIPVEQKGVDAVNMENYSSMALMMNDPAHFRVTAKERRFSVPHITSEKLERIMAFDEIHDFVEELDNEKSYEVAEFGEWLLRRKPKLSNYTPIKGEYYYSIEENNFAGWQQALIELLKEKYLNDFEDTNNYVDQRQLTKACSDSGYVPKRKNKIESFIEREKYRGVQIGEVDLVQNGRGSVNKGRTKWVVRPSEEFFYKFGPGSRGEATGRVMHSEENDDGNEEIDYL